MSTPSVRAAFMLAAITVAALSSSPAIAELPSDLKVAAFAAHAAGAELPEHVSVAGFGPEGQDYVDQEFQDVEFAYAVAMRNGIAFLASPPRPTTVTSRF